MAQASSSTMDRLRQVTNMTEAEQLTPEEEHRHLAVELHDELTDSDYQRFRQEARSRLGEGELSRCSNIMDVFGLLEKKNLIRLGDYGLLREMLRRAGRVDLSEMIRETEERINTADLTRDSGTNKRLQRLIDDSIWYSKMCLETIGDLFVETTLSIKARQEIQEKGTLLLIGGAGEGKSTIVRSLSAYPIEGYLTLGCNDPKEIQKVIKRAAGTALKLLIIVDNPFGTSYTQNNLVEKWLRWIEDLEMLLISNGHKIVLASRRSIWVDVKVHFDQNSLFRNQQNVTSDELTITDKRALLLKYLVGKPPNKAETNHIVKISNPIAFGQCCRLAKEVTGETDKTGRHVLSPSRQVLSRVETERQILSPSGQDIVEIFERPICYLRRQLEIMKKSEKTKYATLCLIMLCGGWLNCKELAGSLCKLSPDVKQRADAVLEACGCANTECGILQTCANELVGNFLEKITDQDTRRKTETYSTIREVYKFSHESRYEAVVMLYANSHFCHCLEFLSSDIIVEIVCPEIYQNPYSHIEQEFAIRASPAYYSDIAQVFTEAIAEKSCDMSRVFQNPCVSDGDFKSAWLESLKRKCSPDEATASDQRSKSAHREWLSEIVDYLLRLVKPTNLYETVEKNLKRACQEGQLELVECLLDNSPLAYISHVCEEGQLELVARSHVCEQALIQASRRGHFDIVCALSHHMRIILKQISGNTSLCEAALGGHIKIVRFLLDHDACARSLDTDGGDGINTKDEDGNTGLHYAARGGHAIIVDYLIERGADITAKNDKGNTTLHWAVREGHSEVVSCLLNHGAEVNNTNMKGNTYLHWAAREGHTEVVACLLNHGAKVGKTNMEGNTDVHWAAREGHTDVVACLLNHGADVNAGNKKGNRCLHWTAREGHTKTICCLMEHNAEVNATNKKGKTALSKAAAFGHTEAVVCLLHWKARVDTRIDIYLLSPLHLAAYWLHHKTVSALLKHEADANMKDSWGQTPLHSVSLKRIKHQITGVAMTEKVRFQYIVDELLEHGADPMIKDMWQRSAMSRVRWMGYPTNIDATYVTEMDTGGEVHLSEPNDSEKADMARAGYWYFRNTFTSV